LGVGVSQPPVFAPLNTSLFRLVLKAGTRLRAVFWVWERAFFGSLDAVVLCDLLKREVLVSGLLCSVERLSIYTEGRRALCYLSEFASWLCEFAVDNNEFIKKNWS